MITIMRARGTGKAKELLEQARINKAMILTLDKRAFEVKAKSYKYDDVVIIDYEDLEADNYNITQPILIHNVEDFLTYALDRYYALQPIGFSATVPHKNMNK